jgi:hypothetical protein
MNDLRKRFPLYSKLLKLYPAAYREKYGQELLQTTADMLDDTPSKFARLGVWTRIVMDFPINLGKQQFQYAGGIMTSQTPQYIKRNGLIGSAFLLPFMVILLLNGLDKVINNRTLYNTWIWSGAVLRIWVFWLPVLALLVTLVSFIFYVLRKSDVKQSSILKRIIDIKHSWPIIIPAVIALGIVFLIMFHDSAHCWVHSPSHLVAHINQPWQCTVKNAASPSKLLGIPQPPPMPHL